MKRFIEGEDRNQRTLFPEALDDYIAEDNPVRVIDVFVDELNLAQLTSKEGGLTLHRYWGTHCEACPLKSQCTTGKERRVIRWEHETILEAMQERLDHDPEIMRLRRQTVEHPYGTLKAWMGSAHFLTRTLNRVSTEMSLHVLVYNLKRIMNILGVKPLIQAMQA